MTDEDERTEEEEAAELLAQDAVVVMSIGDWCQIVGVLDTLTGQFPGVFGEVERITPELKRQIASDPLDLLLDDEEDD